MSRRATAAAYAVIGALLIPAAISVWRPGLGGDARIELRQLQDLPGLPASLEELLAWPRRFDGFASDRFPFRSSVITLGSRALLWMGRSLSPEVMVGREGWLFLRRDSNVLEESRGLKKLTREQVRAWVDAYLDRKKRLESNGTQLLMVFVPNKHTVFSRFLRPWDVPIGETITDQLVMELGARGVSGIVDLRPEMKRRATAENVYDKYDTHWNDRGAYYGYREIAKRLPGAHVIPSEGVAWSLMTRPGDLSGLIGNRSLVETTYEASVLESTIVRSAGDEERANYVREAWSSVTIHRTGPRVLWLCDSFTNGRMYKFLEQSFPESWFKAHQGMRWDEELVERLEPDWVAYVVVERLVPYALLN